MANKTELISKLGQEILRAKDLQGNSWDSLALVIDLDEGHFAQSGYLYTSEEVVPFTAITPERRKLSSLCNELRKLIHEESDAYVKQMLMQIRSQDTSLKIDFEFEDSSRWSITPSNMHQARENLRPTFD